MSAICGLARWDGAPVAPDTLQTMVNVLAHRGGDGRGAWHAGNVGLGHQMRWITPESQHETLPLHDPVSGVTLTADARLDNRDELCDALAVPHPKRHDITDSELILAAYLRWGDDAPRYLIGDFAFALWDSRGQRLLLCTDPFGHRVIFYHHTPTQTVFATEPKGVLAAPGVPRRLNRAKIARMAHLMFMAMEKAESYYQDVVQLPPATLLVVEAGRLHPHTYWQPDPTRRLPYRTDAEIIEALRDLLFRVTAAQTRSAYPLGTLLSGGMDSSSVTAVAARVLHEQGRGLTSLSVVLPRGHDLPVQDERAYIDLFQGTPGLEMADVTAEGYGPFDTLSEAVVGHDGPPLTSRHYVYSAIMDAAAARNIRLIFDGLGGEFGVTSYAPGYLGELLMTGQWRTLLGNARPLVQFQKTTLLRVLVKSALLPFLPVPVQSLVQRGRKTAPVPWLGPMFLQSDFVRQELGEELARVQAQAAKPLRGVPDHRANDVMALQRATGAQTNTFFRGYPQAEFVYPLSDRRVLEFCLAAPGHLKMQRGYPRSLARLALDGILPPAIQWRMDKDPFSPAFARHYNAQRPALHAWLQSLAPNDPRREIIAVDRLVEWTAQPMDLADNRGKQAESYRAMHMVPLGVALLHFLDQFDL